MLYKYLMDFEINTSKNEYNLDHSIILLFTTAVLKHNRKICKEAHACDSLLSFGILLQLLFCL